MAAPSVTARSAPASARLRDGFKSEFAFKLDPTLSLWEIELNPPGFDGGDAVETKTMHNREFETFAARKLKKSTPCEGTCAYAPAALAAIQAAINREDAVTFHNSDYTTWAFWGYLQKFQPEKVKEGDMPKASFTIFVTNTDPSDGTEFGPVYAAASGTAGED